MSGWLNTDAQANNEPKYISSIGRDSNYTNGYSNNTILVTDSRQSNSNTTTHMVDGAVAHSGWVHYELGTGPLVDIAISNTTFGLRFATEYLSIVSANTGSEIPLSSANAQLVVTGAAANVLSIVINDYGSGYTYTPTITGASGNNTTLVFTPTMGGRAGRIQSEVLVALTGSSSTDANAAYPFFTGT